MYIYTYIVKINNKFIYLFINYDFYIYRGILLI
jgi:hypothetical protein